MCNPGDAIPPRTLRGGSAGPAFFSTMLALFLPLATWAQPNNLDIPPAAPQAPPSHMVRELLEQDAQFALYLEQRNEQGAYAVNPITAGSGGTASASTQAPGTASKQPLVQLKSIAGVGRELSATLEKTGKRAVYRAGHATPIMGPDPGYRLQHINPPCAVFADAEQEPITLCLHGGKNE